MKTKNKFGLGVAIGIGAGAAIGVALHAIPIGVGAGAALGVVLGFLMNNQRANEKLSQECCRRQKPLTSVAKVRDLMFGEEKSSCQSLTQLEASGQQLLQNRRSESWLY